MITHKVREKRDNGLRPKAQPVWLEPEDELHITKTVAEIVKEDDLNALAYNICGDHMHLLVVCEEEEVPQIVGKIKASELQRDTISETGNTTAIAITTTRGHVPLSEKKKEKEKSTPLWTQKFGCKEITDSVQLGNTIEYIRNNRLKHELPSHAPSNNKGINPLVEKKDPLVETIETFTCSYEHAYRTEYKGGFDVVIGNPPYVHLEAIKEVSDYSLLSQFLEQHYANF